MKNESDDAFDFKMVFGDQSNETKLIESQFTAKIGKMNEEEAASLPDNDIYIKINFHLIQGQEKDVIDFFQKGMDEDDEEQRNFLTPLQQLFKRPKSFGKVQLQKKPGQVSLLYTLYEEYAYKQFESTFDQFFGSNQNKIDLKWSLLVRGDEDRPINDTIKLQPNFVSFHLTTSQYLWKTVDIMYQMANQHQQQAPFPFFQIFKIKKVKLDFKIASLRRLIRQYLTFSRSDLDQRKHIKTDSFLEKEVIKNKIQIEFKCKKLGTAKITIKFSEQCYLERAIKRLTSLFMFLNHQY